MLTKTQTAPADISATVGRLRALMQWLRRHFLRMVAGPLVLILAVAWGGFYWASARFVVSTDDAYVQAHSTIVASRVSGYISAVLVADDGHMLALIRAAREAGAVSEMDVLSAQSQADHDRTLLPPLQQELSVARDALSSLVGAPPSDWTAPDVNLDDLKLAQHLPVALPSELVHRRPDIDAAEAQLHAASATVGIATADLYPHLTLSAAIGEQGLLGGGPSETAWNVLGGLTAPIFHGGALTAERRAAQDEYRAALASYRQTVVDALSQVADTLQALGNDAESLSTQRRALDPTRSDFRLSKENPDVQQQAYSPTP
jgi:NodT family efflux transporter outer membrane factor (OMF) lipoprotein